MSENRKRSRKSKLIPRDCTDVESDEISSMQIKRENKIVVLSKEEINKSIDSIKLTPPMQFSIKVEVEAYEEDTHANKDIYQTISTNQSGPSPYNLTINQCVISEDVILKQVEELSKITTSLVDKKLEIAVRNLWNKVSGDIEDDRQERMLQDALYEWSEWCQSTSETPRSYKCYICRKGWWHFTPFREHLKSHNEPNVKVDTEINFHECDIILFLERPEDSYVQVEGKCWKCCKSFEKHKLSSRDKNIYYICKGCKGLFRTCSTLKVHEGSCEKLKDNTEKRKCELCLQVLSVEEYEEHLVICHSVRSDVPVSVSLTFCSECNERHVSHTLHICSKSSKHLSCNYCYRKFEKSLWLLHMNMSVENVSCFICNEQLPRQCMEGRHIVEHSDNYVLVYKCPMCVETVLFPDEFSVHQHSLFSHKTMELREESYEIVIVPKKCVENWQTVELEKTCNNRITLSTKAIVHKEPNIDNVFIKTELVDIKQEIEEPEYNNQNGEYSNLQIKQELQEDPLSKVFQASKYFNRTNLEDICPAENLVEVKEENFDEEVYEDDIIILNSDNDVNEFPSKSESFNIEYLEEDEEEINMLNLEPEVILKSGYRKKRLYKCMKCGYEGYHREYKDHIEHRCERTSRTYKNSRPDVYECTKCAKSYSTMKKYVEHFANHNIKYMSCPQCMVNFDNIYHLIRHINVHIKYMFLRIRLLKDVGMDPDMESKTDIIFQCKTCKEKVSGDEFFKHWEMHLQIQETSQEEYNVMVKVENEPERMGDTVLEPAMLRNIIELLTETERQKKTSRLKTCCKCKRVFTRQYDCKRHLIEHLLMDAYINKHKYDSLRCQICSEDFVKQDRYKRHMRDHGSLPIYKCDTCDKAFSDSSNFTKHKKIHNIKVLICDICKKKFQAKISLEKHMEMHQITKPITCDKCNRIFYVQSAYNRHVRQTHDKITYKFGCIICSKKFDSLKKKWDHMWEVHKDRKTKADCPICDMPFRRFLDVKQHAERLHGMNIMNVKLFGVNGKIGNVLKNIKSIKTVNGITVVAKDTTESLIVYE